MAEVGISYVRIGEFAWSRIEPRPGELHFDWLVKSMDVLGRHGLKVIVGTPTATPPHWVIDKMPDMVAIDANGRPRNFWLAAALLLLAPRLPARAEKRSYSACTSAGAPSCSSTCVTVRRAGFSA